MFTSPNVRMTRNLQGRHGEMAGLPPTPALPCWQVCGGDGGHHYVAVDVGSARDDEHVRVTGAGRAHDGAAVSVRVVVTSAWRGRHGIRRDGAEV